MFEIGTFLKEITETDGVSGFEGRVASRIEEAFSPLVDEKRVDNLGNLIFLKKGESKASSPPARVLFCAHMDEIGFLITKLEDEGFLRFTSLGGFDVRTLPGQEVTVYGTRPVKGIIGGKPPHLRRERDKKQGLKTENLFIDTGLSKEEVKEVIQVGSAVAIHRSYLPLLQNSAAGKALDDRAGVAVLLQCANELESVRHEADVYLVATVQEEVGVRGAVVATYGISPDVGVAVDVCHGDFPGALEHEVSKLNKGPAIVAGPNIHPGIGERLVRVAREYQLPYQHELSPGPTGTDARAMQVSLEGIPTGLVSVPLRYMHTSVELVSINDIRTAGRLLAYFARGINRSFVEELTCL